MALKIYRNFPFIPGNELIQVDTNTGDGASATFPLRNKTASQTGSAIQVDTAIKEAALNGFSFPDANDVTLSTVPALNAQIVIPGNQGLVFECFDQTSVPGSLNTPSNTDPEPFWLADDGLGAANIFVDTYQHVNGTPGVALFFQNLCTAAGAQTTWTQLACADSSGNALTYQATGTVLYTADFLSLTSLSASSATLSTTLHILSASSLYAGDYIIINPGGGTQENVQIINISGTTLTTTGQTFDHFSGELVVMNARKFWAKGTIPVNALGGIAQSLFNLGLCVDCYIVPR